jgi:alpha-1,2-mannosyltransferase
MGSSAVAEPGGRPGRVTGTRVLVAGCVLLALSAGALTAVDLTITPGMWSMLDLRIYDWGGLVARHSGNLYGPAYPGQPTGFTYPPAAALVFSVLTYLPLTVLKAAAHAATVADLTMVIWLTWGALGYPRSRARLGGTMVIAAAAIWSEPVQQTLAYGQINVVLMLLIVADLSLAGQVRCKGVGVGLAAGIKLTALIFIPYLLLTRRFRAAGTALATFTATIALAWVWLPAQSATYWAGRLFLDSGRLGNGAYVGNQSLRGMVLRLAGSGRPAAGIWAVAVVIVAACGLLLAAAAARRGREVAGLLICALTGLMISPVSWSHHWVWVAPALVLAADTVVRARDEGWSQRRRRAAWGGVLGLLAVFWTRLIWAVPMPARQGQRLTGGWQLAANLYVLAGLAILGLTAALMAFPRQRGPLRPAPRPEPGELAARPGPPRAFA